MVAYENGPWGLNSLRKTLSGLCQTRLGLKCVQTKWHAFQVKCIPLHEVATHVLLR
jgi:hypothetical protein